MKNNIQSPMLFFPDPLWVPTMISGAVFLYFDGPMLIPIPSSSSIGMLGVGPSKLAELVEKRNPQWGKSFLAMYSLYEAGTQAFSATMKLLEPLHDPCLKWIQLVYPHTTEWMRESEDLVRSTGLSPQDLGRIMHPLTAADSLAKHVLFEMYLSKVHPGEDTFALGQDYVKRSMSGDPIPTESDADQTLLYEYCDSFFSSDPIETLLFRAYGLRLLLLQNIQHAGGLFLSCPQVIELLSRLPVEQEDASAVSVNHDVVAWEVFRQLISPVIDPLDEKRVELIVRYRSDRSEEIGRLKRKCLSLVNSIHSHTPPSELEPIISQFIEREVRSELSDLLELDSKAFRDFTVSLFSDAKTWAALAALVGSILTSHDIITAGSAVAALSNLGAKAVKSAAYRRETLKTSSYTLIYNLQKQVPDTDDEGRADQPAQRDE